MIEVILSVIQDFTTKKMGFYCTSRLAGRREPFGALLIFIS
jgi:hypothetical protein